MNQTTVYDALLAQTWRCALSTLSSVCAEEDRLTLPATWAVSALLEAGFSSKELPIRDYLARLDNWADELERSDELLDESSTGLLGLWLHLCHQQRKRVKGQLKELFLRSVEHNLQKLKPLSLGTNVDLLAAVAAGLSSTSSTSSDKLRTMTSERLQVLSRNANASELVQMLQSWELIRRTDDIPRLDVQHRLGSIAKNKNSIIVERAMAHYGQLRLAELFDTSNIEYEINFLDCLALMAGSTQDRDSMTIRAYVLSLPYLRRQMSCGSLFESWRKYADASFKRAKAENYWGRYLFIVCLAGLISVIYWPWVRQLDVGFQVSLGAAVATAVLMLTAFTIEVTFELYRRPFWQKGKIEIAIGILGALIAVAAAIAEALLR